MDILSRVAGTQSCDGLSGGLSFVVMVKPADVSDLDDLSAINFLNFTMLGTIHLKRQERARAVIVF